MQLSALLQSVIPAAHHDFSNSLQNNYNKHNSLESDTVVDVPLFDVDILKNPAVSDTEVMKLLAVYNTAISTVIFKVELGKN